MKTTRYNFKKIPLNKIVAMLSFAFMIFVLAACDDDDDNTPIPVTEVAYVSLYQGVPDAPAIDIVVDNRTAFYDFDYTEFTGYLNFYTGDRNLKFTPYNASNTLTDTTVTFEDGELYSVFLTGTKDNYETLITNDNIPEADNSNAVIRIVHLSPDAPAISLTKEDESAPLFENVSYKSASDFIEVPAGSTSFDIMASGETTPLASVSDFNFLAGRVYTLVVRGYKDTSESNNGLSVQVIPYFFNY